ncbi:MAG: hypothetical protein H6831_01530 [Planctomycetes bacterium]|nr:hypothetical protein [Planctomycetota bacterium]MCB9903067.1 hypothetical protein [Planctomycetota bacterium]
MIRALPRVLAGTAGAAMLLAAVLAAEIQRLDLSTMVAATDGAVYGKILGREVVRFDHPEDGQDLYFTHLSVEGRSLVDGSAQTVTVTYPGGFIDEVHGVHNSEAPAEDDVKTGNQVVVFYKWSANMGGDLAGNALYASHGGLFRTAQGGKGRVVLGRGDGYAVSKNVLLDELDRNITSIHEELRRDERQK